MVGVLAIPNLMCIDDGIFKQEYGEKIHQYAVQQVDGDVYPVIAFHCQPGEIVIDGKTRGNKTARRERNAVFLEKLRYIMQVSY